MYGKFTISGVGEIRTHDIRLNNILVNVYTKVLVIVFNLTY